MAPSRRAVSGPEDTARLLEAARALHGAHWTRRAHALGRVMAEASFRDRSAGQALRDLAGILREEGFVHGATAALVQARKRAPPHDAPELRARLRIADLLHDEGDFSAAHALLEGIIEDLSLHPRTAGRALEILGEDYYLLAHSPSLRALLRTASRRAEFAAVRIRLAGWLALLSRRRGDIAQANLLLKSCERWMQAARSRPSEEERRVAKAYLDVLDDLK